jgi:hypothetical protein
MNDDIWVPDENDKNTMQEMMRVGHTFSEFYLRSFGRCLGEMLTGLSIALVKMKNGTALTQHDKKHFLGLKQALRKKMQELHSPRFMPGDLAVIGIMDKICTVVSTPTVHTRLRMITIDVLLDGQIVPVSPSKLRKVRNLAVRHFSHA